MLIISRHILLAFLLLLQLLAPLVHAHAFQGATTFGVHLPELEVLAEPVHSVYLQSAETSLVTDTLCVSMNTGIQHKAVDVTTTQDTGHDHPPILPAALALNTQARVNRCVPKVKAWVSQSAKLIFIPSLAPRAPPTLIL